MNWFRKIYSFDYMGHKAVWFTFSGIIIGAGLVSLFVRGGGNPVHGLKYGLEFKSGTRINVVFKKTATIAGVRKLVSGQGYSDAQIQKYTQNGETGLQIQTKTLEVNQQNDLKAALNKAFTIKTNAKGDQLFTLQTVGPVFGQEIISSSWKAAIFALILIMLYVSVRFELKFAIGAIGSEAHDLLVVVGVYSLTGREVTTGTVAAVLTILGYSLYDTIIVFDRVRENAPRMPLPSSPNRVRGAAKRCNRSESWTSAPAAVRANGVCSRANGPTWTKHCCRWSSGTAPGAGRWRFGSPDGIGGRADHGLLTSCRQT